MGIFRWSLCAFLIALFLSTSFAQDNKSKSIIPSLDDAKNEPLVGLEETVISPQQEVETANEFLEKLDAETATFARFFSIYNIPVKDTFPITDPKDETKLINIPAREGIVNVLNFWIHSLSSGRVFKPVTKISPTLFYIDMRDYGWTPQAFEKVSIEEPYFREPWISYAEALKMRALSGNAIVRADWFITHTCDVTKQADRGKAPLYYELLYAVGGPPKTLDDFRKKWGVDAAKIEGLGLEKGWIVDEGTSGVSRNNRQLARARTETGYYYETSDVKVSENQRDYVENLDPNGLSRNDRDAGETFTTNLLGLNVYFLFDSKNNRVEFGDPTVVWDKTDAHDIRVRTARSCVICHAESINIPSNALKEHLTAGVDLVIGTKDYKLAIESFYLTTMGKILQADKDLYKEAVANCNGLTPTANAQLFKSFLTWYERNLSIEHAALECGLAPEDFKAKISAATSGRLAALSKGEKSIPRETWENLNGGGFAQSMLLINKISGYNTVSVVSVDSAEIKNGQKVVANLVRGTELKILREIDATWLEIELEKGKGYIRRDQVQQTVKLTK